MDDILSEIDQKNTQYLRTAIDRVKFHFWTALCGSTAAVFWMKISGSVPLFVLH